MAKSLLIVESPAKAKTISKYLGKDFIVKASMGHIKDLPPKRLGIDVDKEFTPQYVTVNGRTRVLNELKKAASEVDAVYLAPDPDREGEMICWHLQSVLSSKCKTFYRVLFNEITKKAIIKAIESPTEIDQRKVNAQQTRRILDRLVGYKISPLLWKKVRKGLSAGRVQSVAVRLICERQDEIDAFEPQEYWTVAGDFATTDGRKFVAQLERYQGKKLKIENKARCDEALAQIDGAEYAVSDVITKPGTRRPQPPFITSKMQQEAAAKIGFSVKKTMVVAQQLYEGVDIGADGTTGLITYMRTDSVRVSPSALDMVREFIEGEIGPEYLPAKPNFFKQGKQKIQDAHEAIRPTDVSLTPKMVASFLSPQQLRLYTLIWRRFVASQVCPMKVETTTAWITAAEYGFKISGTVVIFDGFQRVHNSFGITGEKKKKADDLMPQLQVPEQIACEKISPEQHFTKPPATYSEATLVKVMEEKGIGRPSTYATIISNILARDYVSKVEKTLIPTELGRLVNGLLIESFPHVLDVAFTASIEDSLDKIEGGSLEWVNVMKDFYGDFATALEKAETGMRNIKKEMEVETEHKCQECSKNMIIKHGRYGRFLACPDFPTCRFTQSLEEVEPAKEDAEPVEDRKCPGCGKSMALKSGKFGRYMHCADCGKSSPLMLSIKCPECSKNDRDGRVTCLTSKKGTSFFGCSNYPDCNFLSWYKPIAQPCPDCNYPILITKETKSGSVVMCSQRSCKYKQERENNE